MNDLLKELEKEFENTKKELKFKVTLDELDDMFFLRDYIQKEGFVSNKLSRQIARRMIDLYMVWVQYLHGLLMPNPGSLVNVIESQVFDDKDKDMMSKIMDRLMALSAESNIIGLTKDKVKEKEFIDNSVVLWKELNPKFVDVLKKLANRWNELEHSKPESHKEINTIYG